MEYIIYYVIRQLLTKNWKIMEIQGLIEICALGPLVF